MRIPLLMRWILLFAILPCSAFPEEAPAIPVSKFTLDNGMCIIVVPRPGSPMVACRLFYRVGSVDEAPGMTGLAHFFEHMMFKGTSQIGVRPGMLSRDRELRLLMDEIAESLNTPGVTETQRTEAKVRMQSLLEEERRDCIVKDEIFGIYREAGGAGMNAFTTHEFTCYTVDLPPTSIETLFWVECDRMHNLEPREFHSEREVVRGERRMRYESKPALLAEMDINRRVYGGTAYSWPVIGWTEDLDRVSCREAMDFYREHYVPKNAVLVLVGDLDPAKIQGLANKYFAPSELTSKGVGRRVRNIPLPLGRSLLEYPIPDDDAVVIKYPLPSATDPSSVASDLLIAYLNGRQGPLHKTLVQEKKLARSCSASRDGFRDADHLTIRCVLRSSVRHEEVLAEIERLVADMKARPLDLARLTAVKRREIIDQYRSFRSDASLAMALGYHEMFGNWEDLLVDARKLQACGADEVHAVLRGVADPLLASMAFIRDTRVARGGP